LRGRKGEDEAPSSTIGFCNLSQPKGRVSVTISLGETRRLYLHPTAPTHWRQS